MNFYQRFMRWAGTKAWSAPLGRQVFTPIDKLMRGRSVSLTTFTTDFPMGYLTTVGRRSGQPRTVPLLYVVPPDGVAAIVGTNFGSPRHPDWVANLEAQPHATWQVDDEIEVVARPAAPTERGTLWAQFVEVWPGYEGYLERSGRDPKMFILDRR